jgi:hypothetical protein
MVCARDAVDDDISTQPSTIFFKGPVIEKKEVKNLFDYRCRKKFFFHSGVWKGEDCRVMGPPWTIIPNQM